MEKDRVLPPETGTGARCPPSLLLSLEVGVPDSAVREEAGGGHRAAVSASLLGRLCGKPQVSISELCKLAGSRHTPVLSQCVLETKKTVPLTGAPSTVHGVNPTVRAALRLKAVKCWGSRRCRAPQAGRLIAADASSPRTEPQVQLKSQRDSQQGSFVLADKVVHLFISEKKHSHLLVHSQEPTVAGSWTPPRSPAWGAGLLPGLPRGELDSSRVSRAGSWTPPGSPARGAGLLPGLPRGELDSSRSPAWGAGLLPGLPRGGRNLTTSASQGVGICRESRARTRSTDVGARVSRRRSCWARYPPYFRFHVKDERPRAAKRVLEKNEAGGVSPLVVKLYSRLQKAAVGLAKGRTASPWHQTARNRPATSSLIKAQSVEKG
nr:uncharacterized protein LOC127486193 [Oryctolagus cuniculus]XP_051685915.1 uncharacterized protein LOC127486193 [Oryctolagus cuniculus]XP_051685916.1 uncharacterized protein LOC127486193 [Oryctolagus cuniculus]XP_051685917.1 uncharacterized protein LOC127486193 [Oryctolagus cuniculus]XP_051685918.1 uncharacterized protein LOC127486193 [Oryctolagus cuniculus]XP_051685919.1 uncharacterized protein LOC127486193 [Oryctolagus cuniculus]XP_051685921.1 uncharacterized protein LOC127486193 [Orycto